MEALQQEFTSFDGERLAYLIIGEGPPVVLVHGFLSGPQINWIKYGTARRITVQGRSLILPVLRGHNTDLKRKANADDSPLPADCLIDDLQALLDHLDLSSFDLGGYSLGAYITTRYLTRSPRRTPRQILLSGMGLDGLKKRRSRVAYYEKIIQALDDLTPRDPNYRVARFIKMSGVSARQALLALKTCVDLEDVKALAAITTPCLLLYGVEDHDSGSVGALAELLPRSIMKTVPGNHLGCVTRPEFGRAIADWFAQD